MTLDTHQLAKDRGRHAITPRQLPPRAWFDVLRRFGGGFLDDHLMLVAAGVAYYSLLALFPAIALFVSIYGLISDPSKAADQALALSAVVPDDAAKFLYDEMTRVASTSAPKLGIASIIAFLVALWGSNRSMKAMFEALNVAYREKERRNILVINLLSLGFTFGFIFFAAMTLILVVAVPPLLEALRLPLVAELGLSLLRWPVLFGGMVAGTMLLYRYGPSRRPARLSWVTWGSVLAGVLWLLASGLISWYAASVADFGKTYGSLGAVILLQTWIWVTSLVVITGAKINAEAEHQTAVDTTSGRPRPLGERGAVVADSLGRVRPPKPKEE
ncbi:YihY/virulence factor BrkB family protein [Parvularcula dongshanensis]|uniref:Membrane protein n=1 Tax=Parvularcula dongshanensis TaxID=1173995 RepID=A0A840I2D5_9PROT|nr:YihY/virulence factor BrkB family protein [Parvularcula dongshanensis]MBB4658495.1 membrane protein [Parvularcula dongshanensis]